MTLTQQIEMAKAAILRDWWNCAENRPWSEDDMKLLTFTECEGGVTVEDAACTLRVFFQDGKEIMCCDPEEPGA